MKFSIKLPRLQDILLIYFFSLQFMRRYIFSHLPGRNVLALLCLVALIAATMLKDKNFIYKYKDIFIYFGTIVVIFGFQFIINPETRVWLTREFGIGIALIMGGIFAYPVIRLQDDFSRMIRGLKISALLLGLMYAKMVLEPIRKGYWEYTQFGKIMRNSSNMSWSYGVLFVICVCSYMIIAEKKKYMCIPVAAGLAGILLYGSRGTIISFVIGTALTILFYNNDKQDYRKYIVVIAAALAVAFVFSDTGISLIAGLAEKYELDSRFIRSFVRASQGDSSFSDESSGRDRIWKLVIKLIAEKPLGYGVMGHRNAIYSIGIKWGYSHNIFLDLLAEWGVLVGSALILLAGAGIMRFLLVVKNKPEKLLFIMFITVSCELLLSGYMWIHYGVWALLALYINHFAFNWTKDRPIDMLLKLIKHKGAKK
ncbi:MAG: O-antigen ligase family protein [Ruminococcus sp.]|nr:O-antigen ligase family protein [Ruminococcus sp.]